MDMRRTSNLPIQGVLKKGELLCILIFVMQFVARRRTIHERHANAHRFPVKLAHSGSVTFFIYLTNIK